MSDYEYKKSKYDTIVFRVKKGKATEYRQAAQDLGVGFWNLLQTGVEEFIANHLGGDFLPVKPAPMTKEPPAEKLTSVERTLLDEFNRLPVDVQKAFLKTFKAINAAQDADNQSASLQ